VLLFDEELSPRHQRELEQICGDNLRIVDRTALILDVFAQHARTREGTLQVELAQYEYRLPRLTRAWTHLARQAGGGAGRSGSVGGVGLRGPGETQLEVDRRDIGRRITHLRRELEKVREQRRQHRTRRQSSAHPTVALVGYTNAGKSTLLNCMADADVYVADQLFATLDPTTRRIELGGKRAALLTDTVGFIQKLPTTLIAAFRATLEEIAEADLLLHVVDITHQYAHAQALAVRDTLAEIQALAVPMVTALNKIDLLPDPQSALDRVDEFERAVPISAITGEGIPETAELTASLIKDLGGWARVVKTRSHPLVLGGLKGASDHKLLRYDMYDVQPVDPVDEWVVPPWSAEIRGDRIIARGAQNNKGPLRAYFNALETILDVEGELPCSIDFIIEGEEEIGSHALTAYVNEHREDFLGYEQMDGWFAYQPTPTSPPPIECGFKGCVFFELVAKAPMDLHSMMAAVVDNPAWRLVWALDSMRDASDRVAVEGFYDDVVPPTEEERANLPKLASYLDLPRQWGNVERLRGEARRSPEEMLEELFFRPSPINVQGLTSGWQGNGCKTITPGEAVAKIDIRTVARQDGRKLLEVIRRHLEVRGFGDLEIRAVDVTPWSRSPMDSTGVRAAAQACRDLGWEPMIVPTDPGTGPSYLFTNNPPLHLSEFFGGLGHGGSIHAPNEYFLLEGVRLFEKGAVNYLHHWADLASQSD